MSKIEVQLSEPQYRFLTSEAPVALFSAGIGSGKSFAGAHWARNMMSMHPEAKGFIGAVTWSQLVNATLATFFSVLDDFAIPYSYNAQRKIITAAGRRIYAYSLENYNACRGIECGWIWLDEVRDVPKAAFDVVIGRLRDKNIPRRLVRLTSSPNGFDWLYDEFAGPDKKPSYEVIFGRTQDNPFLPDGYAESLKESYDAKAYEQEVLGRFVNLTSGATYYAFDRATNVKPQLRDLNQKVRIGLDFNLLPMAAVAGQYINGTLHILKEYFMMGSNTHEMAEAILADFGPGTEIIPDSTGKALKTASRGLSDHQILRDAGLTVMATRNPARQDRYNCINGMLEHGRIEIDPSCKNLIRDFEKVHYKPGSNELDVGDKHLTHVSDACGYLAWYLSPLIRLSSGVVQLR